MHYVFLLILRWPRELNALQLQKTHANKKSTSKLRKHLHCFDSTHAANPHNTCKLRNAQQMLTTQPNTFYLQRVSFFGCVVSICSVCVIKLTKVFSYFAGVFFYLQRVSFLGCVVGICSVCVVKLRKLFP